VGFDGVIRHYLRWLRGGVLSDKTKAKEKGNSQKRGLPGGKLLGLQKGKKSLFQGEKMILHGEKNRKERATNKRMKVSFNQIDIGGPLPRKKKKDFVGKNEREKAKKTSH